MNKRLIDTGLKELKDMSLNMGLYSLASFQKSIDAFVKWKNIKDDLISRSYQLMMKREEINSIAVELIARYQPLASDLRYLKSAMDIAYNFLRIGRYSADIVITIADFEDVRGKCDIGIASNLIKVVENMLNLSVELLEKPDSKKAENIYTLDSIADEEYRKVLEEIMGSRNLKCGLALALVSRYLERIGDHAYYIGDSVYYYLEGSRLTKI